MKHSTFVPEDITLYSVLLQLFLEKGFSFGPLIPAPGYRDVLCCCSEAGHMDPRPGIIRPIVADSERRHKLTGRLVNIWNNQMSEITNTERYL